MKSNNLKIFLYCKEYFTPEDNMKEQKPAFKKTLFQENIQLQVISNNK